MGNQKPIQLVDECDRLFQLLQEISPGLTVGKINVATVASASADLRESANVVADTKSKLISYRTQSKKRERVAKQVMSAMRDAVRSEFGPDSPEYERTGRTPLSKRGRNTTSKTTIDGGAGDAGLTRAQLLAV